MNHSPQDIVDILLAGEAVRVQPILDHLRRDSELLHRVGALAQQSGVYLENLANLVLEIDAPRLIFEFKDCEDLESGLWLLPKIHDPSGDYAGPGRHSIDAMAERLQHHADAGAVANALGKEWGFSGDQRRYHRPENCFFKPLSRPAFGHADHPGVPVDAHLPALGLCQQSHCPARARGWWLGWGLCGLL